MMSCAGTDWVSTPNMDRLASEGTRFENAICANPVCLPSRVSIATGLMPSQIGILDNENGRDAVLPERVAENSLGMLMKRAGYETYYGGKVHMCPQLVPTQAGYDHFFPNERTTLADTLNLFFQQDRAAPFFAVASFINPHDICFVHNAKVDRQPQMTSVTDLYHQAIELPDAVLPPLPENYSITDAEPPGTTMRHNHTSITPSGTMSDTYSEPDWRVYRWVYARLTEQVDLQIGRILAGLDRAGHADDTAVVFTSDHGNMHGNHQLASKFSFYRESVGVPFIVRYPGEIDGGAVDRTTLINNGTDILPTCCDYAGVELPEWLHGQTVRAAASSVQNPMGPGAAGTASTPGRAGEPRFVVAENATGTMILSNAWKYVEYVSGEPKELLIDLVNDPEEMWNLAGRPECRAVLRQMRDQLAGMRERELAPVT